MFELCGDSWGPLACWVTGWLNLLGQVASISSSQYLLANLIASLVDLGTGEDGAAVILTAHQTFGRGQGC